MTRSISVQLRWSDLDAQAHLNNVTTVALLQEARAAYFMQTPLSSMLGTGCVVVDHSIEYRGSVEFGKEPLRVDVSVVDVGTSRFGIGYEIYSGDVLTTRATTRLCPYDFETGRPRRLVAEEKAFLLAEKVDVEPMSKIPKVEIAKPHVLDMQVRWGDQDHYGHVNNVHYLDYVQQARVTMMIDADPRALRMGHDDAEFAWLIVRQDIQYLAQLNYRPDPVHVRTVVSRLGKTSVSMCYDIVDAEGTCYATAQSVLVCADVHGKPMTIPVGLRAGMVQYLVS